MLEEKMEWVMLGEALMADTKLDFLRLYNAIVEVKRNFLVLEDEEKTIQKQLESMKKINGNFFGQNP